MEPIQLPPYVQHARLRKWVIETAQQHAGSHHMVRWIGGRNRTLCAELVAGGTLIPLNDSKRPRSFLARSDPKDVARVEDRTFICSAAAEDAGPTNNWADPTQTEATLRALFDGCMKGRTLYVVPFSMGPVGSPLAKLGVELTDSAYVAVSMPSMTRMGLAALDALGEDGDFDPCLHSVGMPFGSGQADVPWPCHPTQEYIGAFSGRAKHLVVRQGYGGNALLGKKCLALRIASNMGRSQGWLAEHMLF